MLSKIDRVKGYEYLISKTHIKTRLKRFQTFLGKRYIKLVKNRFSETEKELMEILPSDFINTYNGELWLDVYIAEYLHVHGYYHLYNERLRPWRVIKLPEKIYAFQNDWEEKEKIFKEAKMKAGLRKYGKLLSEFIETSDMIESFLKETNKTCIKDNFPDLYLYLYGNRTSTKQRITKN